MSDIVNKNQIIAKAEKLVTATYLVASYLDESEPLKNKIKEMSLTFLSDMYKTNEIDPANEVVFLRKAKQGIKDIVGFLSLSSATMLISPMNYSILRDEYFGLQKSIQLIEKGDAMLSPSNVISRDFFALTDIEENKPVFVGEINKPMYKGQTIKDNTSTLSFITKKEISSPIGKATRTLPQRQESFDKAKGERREGILRIIKKKNSVTIKDLSDVVVGCSEKTIQRELLALVLGGVLKKEGEKRWSRYSLAG